MVISIYYLVYFTLLNFTLIQLNNTLLYYYFWLFGILIYKYYFNFKLFDSVFNLVHTVFEGDDRKFLFY